MCLLDETWLELLLVTLMSKWVGKAKEKSELGMILSQSIYDDDLLLLLLLLLLEGSLDLFRSWSEGGFEPIFIFIFIFYFLHSLRVLYLKCQSVAKSYKPWRSHGDIK